jgi:hypothetical protein
LSCKIDQIILNIIHIIDFICSFMINWQCFFTLVYYLENNKSEL